MSVARASQPRGARIFGAVFVALPALLVAFHLAQHYPASSYVDAMARGQYTRAESLLQAEMQKNNPSARSAMANLYYLGLGVNRDYRKAATLYHGAASQGYAAAQLNLGHLYMQGLGVGKDTERAFGWYVHADIAGSPWAEYYLSQLSSELTLTPLQMESVKNRWHKLDSLSAEPL